MLFIFPYAQAQNSTSSPFSILGIGEIESRDFGRTTGMGSVGIGLQSENFLNRCNPAGLSGIDTLRFILDVSAGLKLSDFSTSARNGRTVDFTFKSLAIGVRLTKKWTSSVGLSPYSNVGYQLSRQQEIPGTTEKNYIVFSGNGGINSFYWANAYEIFRGLSLGITSSYIFGNCTHSEEGDIFVIKNTYQVNKLNFDFGAQYSQWFGEHTNITVGGIYGYESKMPIEHRRMITTGNSIELNQRKPDLKSYIPEMYGAGFSFLRNKKAAEWVFAADYKYQNWSVNNMRYKTLTYTDSHIYSAGFQITPNKTRPESYIQTMRFHLGACYNKSYLKVHGYQMEDFSVSLGVGLPIFNIYRGTESYVNIAVNVGEAATGKRGGITERYVLLTVNLSLIERWFAPRRWD